MSKTLPEIRKELDREGRVELVGKRSGKLAAMMKDIAKAYRTETGGKVSGFQREVGKWRRRKGFETNWGNVPEKLMLMVTELAEAMEAYRHLKPAFLEAIQQAEDAPVSAPAEGFGDQIVWVQNFEEELADTAIRLFDLCEALDVDLEEAICQKMGKNELRSHKHSKEC
jgi:NTP pyrophosphatase (non-canonical NTP hydrolase)